MNSALGIHHITMITRKVQANVDFYAGFLGLRLAKRTAGFEDAMQLHLLYGDDIASPGSLLTFLVWEDGGQGRVGYGQTLEISVAIDPAAIGFWLTRALKFGIRVEGPSDEFGAPVIRLKDPDGLIVKLVGTHAFADATPHVTDDISAEDAIRRIYGATVLSEVPEETVAFLEKHFGYRQESQAGAIRRLVSDSGDIIDVRDATGFWSSAPGTGTVDHIAFRAKDMDELNAVHTGLKSLNSSTTNAHDRKYFHSLYVREPGGVLIEMATDGPGMTVDEPLESLGEKLFIPPLFMKDEADVRVALPQFAMPGKERIVYRDLPFVHRFYTPEEPDGSTIILLHPSRRARPQHGGRHRPLVPPQSRFQLRPEGYRRRSGSLRRLRGGGDTVLWSRPFETAVYRPFQWRKFLRGLCRALSRTCRRRAALSPDAGSGNMAADRSFRPQCPACGGRARQISRQGARIAGPAGGERSKSRDGNGRRRA
jgi:phospholipase/carboxylesterase